MLTAVRPSKVLYGILPIAVVHEGIPAMSVNADTREEASRSSLRRERCTAEVRGQAIINAATEVFLERGYAEASVDAIVERAGGSKATVYAMFGNKEGLFEAAITQGCGVFAALVGAVRP